jgi:IS1 family transposase
MGFRKKKGHNEPFDEIWDRGCFEAENTEAKDEELGGTWIWTAIDVNSKLIICHWVGHRTLDDARMLLYSLSGRLLNAPLFVSDELVHYATILAEIYHDKLPVEPTGLPGRPRKAKKVIKPELMYATVKKTRKGRKIIKVERKIVYGDKATILKLLEKSQSRTINTSFIERSNINWRIWDAHLGRKSLLFAKSLEYLKAKLAISIAYYNFGRPHRTLSIRLDPLTNKRKFVPTTPAMASGLTDHPWTFSEILGLN